MPSKSAKQHRFFQAVAHSPAFAKKVGVPQSVGFDFTKADKGRKFAKGGDMKKIPPFMGKETPKEEKREMAIKAKSPAKYHMGEKAEGIHGKSGMEKPSKYARGGGIEAKGKTQGKMIKMASGGNVNDYLAQEPSSGLTKAEQAAQKTKSAKPAPMPAPTASAPKAANKPVKYKGDVPVDEPTKNYTKGGCVKMARGGGCEARGKTKGRFV